MKSSILYSVLILILLSGGSCARPPAGEDLSMGGTAPAFRLLDLQGHEVALEQFRGKIVMLDFWATWCHPCTISMPILEDLQKEYRDDMLLLAINMEEPREAVAAYAENHKLRSRILLDDAGKVARIYGATSIPMQILIDRNGVIRHMQVGVGPRMANQLRAEINKLR
jgi:thiol-disulfide isomerase/thioredoxin